MSSFFRKEYSLLLIFWGISYSIFAQIRPVAGEYHLQGIMETASALLLKRDSTFELYFSYGAADRKGSGKWSLANGRITLNSRPRPATDFELVEQKSTSDTLTTITIITPNQQFLPFIEVMLRSANGDREGKPDNHGIFRAEKVPLTAIELFFSLCPERFSTFPVDPKSNHFTFKILPWISEIFLENVVLTVTKKGLTGQHPLLKGDQFEYDRAR
jgi:hypothetical protein